MPAYVALLGDGSGAVASTSITGEEPDSCRDFLSDSIHRYIALNHLCVSARLTMSLLPNELSIRFEGDESTVPKT